MSLGTPVADGPPLADAQSTDRGHYDRTNPVMRRLRVARSTDARQPSVDGTRASPAGRSDHGHDALAADGGIVRIREVTSADRPDLADLHERTSDENLYRRFLGSGRGGIDRELDRLTRPPGREHLAVLAHEGGRAVGVASYEAARSGRRRVRGPRRRCGPGRGHRHAAAGAARRDRPPRGHRRAGRRRAGRQRRDAAGGPGLGPGLRRSAATTACAGCGCPPTRRTTPRWRPATGGRERTLAAAAARAAVGRGGRRRPRTGRHRARGAARAAGRRLHRPRLRGQPARRRGRRAAWRTRRRRGHPEPGRPGGRRRARRRRSRDVIADCGAAGVRRRRHPDLRLRRDRRRGQRPPQARAGPRWPARYGMRLVGPNCLGVLNTDPAIRLTRHVRRRSLPAGRRAGRRVAVRRGRHRDPRPRRPDRHRHLQLRVAGQQGRRQRQRPAVVLVRRPGDPGGRAVPGVVRQPAPVRPDRPRAGPPQAGPGGQERPSGGGSAGRRLAHRGRGRAGRRRGHAVRPGRRDPRRHPRRAARHRPDADRPAAARRATGSRSSATPAASTCWPPTRPRPPG